MSVEVDFYRWGTIYLAPGRDTTWWFTWIFDGHYWSRFSALPLSDSPNGGSVQIVEEWATKGTHWVHFRNNGSEGVLFQPSVIVTPSRY